jgi:hypothetical protein
MFFFSIFGKRGGSGFCRVPYETNGICISALGSLPAGHTWVLWRLARPKSAWPGALCLGERGTVCSTTAALCATVDAVLERASRVREPPENSGCEREPEYRLPICFWPFWLSIRCGSAGVPSRRAAGDAGTFLEQLAFGAALTARIT